MFTGVDKEETPRLFELVRRQFSVLNNIEGRFFDEKLTSHELEKSWGSFFVNSLYVVSG